MVVTADHIRYAETTQLAQLLGCSRGLISRAMSEREYYESVLAMAVATGLPKSVVVKGLRSRVQDFQHKRTMQQQFNELLKNKAA